MTAGQQELVEYLETAGTWVPIDMARRLFAPRTLRSAIDSGIVACSNGTIGLAVELQAPLDQRTASLAQLMSQPVGTRLADADRLLCDD